MGCKRATHCALIKSPCLTTAVVYGKIPVSLVIFSFILGVVIQIQIISSPAVLAKPDIFFWSKSATFSRLAKYRRPL
jgi:hypothetical protein